jgi:hypothetical protein
MKRTAFPICLTILCLALVPALHAQTHAVDEGSFLLGGDASLTRTSVERPGDGDRSTAFNFNLHPVVQYFITPGLAVGGDVSFAYASSEGGSTNYGVGIGPSAAYFFGRGERNYYPFLSGSINASHYGGTALTYRGAGGMLIMLSESVGLTGELFYLAQDVNERDVSRFGLAFGISAFVF